MTKTLLGILAILVLLQAPAQAGGLVCHANSMQMTLNDLLKDGKLAKAKEFALSQISILDDWLADENVPKKLKPYITNMIIEMKRVYNAANLAQAKKALKRFGIAAGKFAMVSMGGDDQEEEQEVALDEADPDVAAAVPSKQTH